MSVLLKSIDYFKIKQLRLHKNNEIKEIIHRNFPDVRFSDKEGKMLWVSKNEAESAITTLSNENNFQNDDILLIDAIHATEENYKVWKKVKVHKKVTVTVDMFFCGAVFFRKEQVKEHFKIRI